MFENTSFASVTLNLLDGLPRRMSMSGKAAMRRTRMLASGNDDDSGLNDIGRRRNLSPTEVFIWRMSEQRSNRGTLMKLSLVSTLALSLLLSSAAYADDKVVKIGSLSDQSSLYADAGGPGSTLAAQMAVEDSGLTAKGLDDQRHCGRPPEQARRRLWNCPQMVRRGQDRRDRRRTQFRRSPRGVGRRQGKEWRRSSTRAPPPPI